MINIILNKSKLFALISVIFLTGSVSGAAQNVDIDLSDALRLAMENNEDYLIAKKELERANSLVIEAASGAFPQITGGLTYLKNWRVPTSVFQFGDEVVTVKLGTDHAYTADLTLTQPLYSGGKTFAALKIARLYKKLSKETLRQAGQELKLQVFRSFYGAVLAGEINRVSARSLKLAEENLDVVEKMFEQGMASEYDLLRARVGVANLRPTVTKSATDYEVANSALKNLLGIESSSDLNLLVDFDSTQFIIPELVIEGSKEILIQERPEIKISEYTSAGRKKAISLYTAGYKPSLTFQTSLQYQTQFDDGSVFEKKWDRSLSSFLILSVPIFDSWKTPSRVRQARIDYVQSRLKEEAIRKSMILDLEQTYGKYLEARQDLSAQGNATELARRGLDIATVRFENGVGTQLEISDARLQLQIAEINKATAFYDLAVSYASLMRALGRDPASLK